MLLKLSKAKNGLVYKNPTIFFETQNKNKDNLILIPSLKEQTMIDVINSDLLRAANIKSIYTPFRITPMKRRRVVIPLKEYYDNIFSKTNRKISLGRKNILAYSNKNLIFDFNNEWRQTIELVENLRGENTRTTQYISQYMFMALRESIESAGYLNNILIVPYDGSVDDFRILVKKRSYVGDTDFLVDPATIITRAFLNFDEGSKNSLFKGIRYIVFYNTNAKSMIKFDLENIDINELKSKHIERLFKLYKQGTKGQEQFLADEVYSEEDAINDNSLDTKDIVVETKFEEVVKKFYEVNKIKNVEVEPNTDPQDNIYLSIVDSIKKHENSDNLDINKLIEDPTIKANLTRYAGLKKKETQNILRAEENVREEIEVLYNEFKKLPVIDIEKYSSIEEHVDQTAAKDIRLKELSHTPISILSKEYIDKQFKDDIINITSSLSNNSILPLSMKKIEFEDSSNANNQLYKLNLGYTVNLNGENKEIRFSVNIPKIIDNHFLYLNGNRWTVDNQLAFLPVTKTDPDSVKITTNYSILFIDREKGYLSKTINQVLKLIDNRKNDQKVKVKYGNNLLSYSKNNIKNIEYSEICKNIYSIEKNGYSLNFNYDDISSELKLNDVPKKYWQYPEDLIPFGYKLGEGVNNLLFIYKNKIYSTDYTKDTLVSDTLAEFIYRDIYDTRFEDLPETGNKMGYSKIKIAGSHYPLILILGMIYGLKNTMNRYKIPYVISKDKNPKLGYVEIKFKDVYLYYKETIENQVLMNGLYFAKPHDFNLDSFNASEPYDEWIGLIKKISTSTKTHFKNTMKITLNVLVDPITQEILNEQKIPSNILDLLLYCNTLLADNSYRQLGNVLNYRLRNYEQIAGMLNQILIKSYIDYLNGYLRGNTRNTFDVNENSVILNLLKISSVNTYSALSPVLELETYSRTSQKGFMGLEKADSFSQATREFNNNKLSVYSAGATAFGGSSGITRSLTYQPHIKGIRGYISEIEDIENTPDTRMLSASELLSPFLSRHADASRQSMAIGQFKHNMPLNKGSVRLWSTGAEQVVPGLLSSDFIFKAKKDGTVKSFNRDTNIVELDYVDGTKDYIDLSTTFIRNSANAFYTPNKLIMRLIEKDMFKKGDIIAYNDVFFKANNDGKVELLVGTLAKMAIAPIDNSFEDSTIITKNLSKKGTSRVVIAEMVRLTPTTKIKNMSKIGDHVDETTAVIEYDDFGDNSIDGFLTNSFTDKYSEIEDILPSSTKYPNYHGVIKDIEVFYNVDKEDLNPSLVKLINDFGGQYDNKLNFVGEKNAYLLKQKRPEKQTITAKEDGEGYEGVMIKFYIQSNVSLGIGDKLSYDTALKGVISNVLDDNEAPYSEHRPEEEIECVLTPTGVFSRMTHDIFYLMFTNKLLIELGRQIGEIRDGKR